MQTFQVGEDYYWKYHIATFFRLIRVFSGLGVRLPRQVGQAVSIVGALVLGEAAVQAGLVAPVTVILVSFTGICTLTLPVQTGAYALRLLRFPVIIVSGFLGYVGMVTMGILILIHLCSLRSFGVPYLAPLAPSNYSELTDTIIRRPLFYNKKRPSLFRAVNQMRFGRERK